MKTPADLENHSADRPSMPSGYQIDVKTEGMLTWDWVRACMTRSRNYWISSTRPDGRPHAMPVWGVWLDDTLYFGTARESRKARNLAANPAVSAHTESGDETVIIEGVAEAIENREVFNRVTAEIAEKYPGMPPEAEPDPDNILYAVKPQVIFAWREKDFPHSATRWRLSK